MTEQDIKDFAVALAHEYVRVRQEWFDAIFKVNDTRWDRDKEIWHYMIALELKEKTQAKWDQMFRVCEELLPKEIKNAFEAELSQIEMRRFRP
ncbi:hypothetical protein [Paenibacillus sp. FSL M7-0896]|uniref:hypothetical protein n=1 Tax=Paenibacillus sp. FSL M7-0896 TaxID=2921610 RepID=UPI0030D7B1FB